MPRPRLTVIEHPLGGDSSDAARLGVPQGTLDRMIKICATALNPGTAAEGERASKLLADLLRRHGLERAKLEEVMLPSSEKEALSVGGRFYVATQSRRLAVWMTLLMSAIDELLGTKSYVSGYGETRYCFYGVREQAELAAATLVELAELVETFVDEYVEREGRGGTVVRNRFREGLGDAFFERCRSVKEQRARLVSEAEERAFKRRKAEALERARAEAREALAQEERLPAQRQEAPPPAPAPAHHADESDDDVVFVGIKTAEEIRKEKMSEAVVIDDDDEQLALVVRRDAAVVDAVEVVLRREKLISDRLGPKRKSQHDQAAYAAGKACVDRMPLGKHICGEAV